MKKIAMPTRGTLPLLVLALATGACDGGDDLVVTDPGVAGVDGILAMNVYAGIPFGPSALWTDNATVKWGPAPFTSSINGTEAATVVRLINAARAKNQKLLLNMTGGSHTRYKTDGKFDLAKWKAVMDTYNTAQIKAAVLAGVGDGTVIMNSVMDEPSITDWGGVMTKPLLDEMARYVKTIFPTLPAGVVARWDWRPEERYQVIDAILAQYQWNKGSITAYRDNILAQAQREGIAVVFSMNILDGGIMSWSTKDCPIPLTGGFGTKVPNCRMTANQVRDWGRLLGVAGCAMSMWRYDQAFMANPENQQAFNDVAATLAAVPGRPCRRVGGGGTPPPNIPPNAVFTAPSCTVGVACQFTDDSRDDDGSIASRSWEFGNGETSTEANPSTTFAPEGSYSVTLTVTDDAGDTDAVTRSVTVDPPAPTNSPPTAAFIAPNCTAGVPCPFTDDSHDDDGSIAGRLWAFGSGATSTQSNPTHTFGTAGSYDVTLTVTDNAGDTDAVSKSVTVSSAPSPPPEANFSSSCTGLTCSFTDGSTDPDGKITARSWAFGDGATSVAPNPSRTYATAGTYSVTLTITYNGGTDQHTAPVTVSAPAPSIVLTVTGRTDATHQYMTLTWTGARGTNVAVYRNGKLWGKTVNDGTWTNSRVLPGLASYTYKVCQVNTTICSNEATVRFR